MQKPITRTIVVITTLSLLGLAACGKLGEEGGEGGEGGGGGTVSTDLCKSGMQWSGHGESGEMDPGGQCVSCHSRGEGPDYSVAGTVFPAYDSADNCYGVEGVHVEVTDANGKAHTTTTNRAGNFWFREAIPTPYSTRIFTDAGDEISMVAQQTAADCNSCHTQNGANLAPGRIITPAM